MTLTRLQRQIVDKIRKPSDRSKQKLVGASQIGGCPLCLGREMAKSLLPIAEQPDREEGGMAAWIGTACHYFLEHNLGLGEPEKKVDIFEVAGYGMIRGHIDLYYENEIFDWKFLGKYSYDKMLLDYRLDSTKLPKTVYRAQQHSYAYGLRKLGYQVDAVNIAAFRKDSNRWEDIAWYREPYNEQLVLAAQRRTQMIFDDYVCGGKVEELPSEEGCYQCERGMFY